jgi:hypothetical protein
MPALQSSFQKVLPIVRAIICCILVVPILIGCSGLHKESEIAQADSKLHMESIEWCRIWITNADKTDLPRVLLVGDSITMGYYAGVEKQLTGKAYCGYLSTSKSICDPTLMDELKTVLQQYDFQVIHFNNGLHGWDYTEEEYRQAFPKMLAYLKKNCEYVIWCNTTPVLPHSGMASRAGRVKLRNDIAAAYANKAGVTTNDLYSSMLDHTEYYRKDGIHFNGKGREVQSKLVCESIVRCLP